LWNPRQKKIFGLFLRHGQANGCGRIVTCHTVLMQLWMRYSLVRLSVSQMAPTIGPFATTSTGLDG
jgi:hypothetical protein